MYVIDIVDVLRSPLGLLRHLAITWRQFDVVVENLAKDASSAIGVPFYPYKADGRAR